jgi:hypothetical protein
MTIKTKATSRMGLKFFSTVYLAKKATGITTKIADKIDECGSQAIYFIFQKKYNSTQNFSDI